MVDVPVNASRRKRTAGAAAARESHKSVRSGLVSTAIVLVLAAAAVTCLIIPNEIDEAIGRTATAISDQKAVAGETLASVVSIATEREDEVVPVSMSIPSATVLRQGESLATDGDERAVMTSGHDILRLEPQTAIMAGRGEQDSPASVIELLYGTLHVKAAKRGDGDTLSIETPFLVATVKGTAFEVKALDEGTAVSVTEGLVSVRSTHSGEAIDVTPGHTAVVSTVHGMLPTMVATPPGGAAEAIKVAVSGSVSNSNHHRP